VIAVVLLLHVGAAPPLLLPLLLLGARPFYGEVFPHVSLVHFFR
jgi:hypothetical protein